MRNSYGSHRKKLTLLVVALATVSAALSACGGGGSDAQSTAAGGGGLSASAGASSPQFRWELKFTHCLREQGISVADPDPVEGAPAVEHDAAYLAASKVCQEQIGEPPAASSSPGVEKGRSEAALKMASCLREHGVDAADPGPEEALVVPQGTSSKVIDECTSGDGR
jgi:hypothetical protein